MVSLWVGFFNRCITIPSCKEQLLAILLTSYSASLAITFSFRQFTHIFMENDLTAKVYVDKVGNTDQTIILMVAGCKFIKLTH